MAAPTEPQHSSPPNSAVLFAPVDDQGRMPDGDHLSVAFVKGGKRKRLSKACDACHKSKRRCDGTAPCSNCYYASKNCTYTDAAGRPVPAPRTVHPERAGGGAAVATQPINDSPPWAAQATLASPPVRPQAAVERDPTTKRRKGGVAPDTSPPMSSKSAVYTEGYKRAPDPAITHELVNIFFAHCNPQRMIIHKPSFSADLGMSKLPPYLLLAVCAVAAPLSKNKSVLSKASHPRLAGVPFFQDALALMFDNSGRLLCEPSVSTAQALCLLEMHEIAASHSWTRHFRYFELAAQVLEGSLEVQRPDETVPPSPNDSEGILRFIDRECTRRCFWLIQTMEWISDIYTHRGVKPRMAELADVVRLPIDEAIFELTSLTSSATVEYLRRPAPRTRYASQFGHMLRILEIYDSVEKILANKEGPARVEAMPAVRKSLEDWAASLPSHLQFNEENLETQITMFETSSNSGAWCWCFMHALHPCCYLAILEGEGTLTEPIPWVRNQLNHIFNAAGTRARSSILSACALWSYSKYSGDDPQVHVWDRDFEKIWGFKVVLVAEQWRQSQALEKEKMLAQQQQQQQQQPPKLPSPPHSQQMFSSRDSGSSPPSSKSSSNSPTSAHSSPSTFTHSTSTRSSPPSVLSQPYEGRQGNPRVLLRSNGPLTELDTSAGPAPATTNGVSPGEQMNLPSLKASGLLDSWKPPSEAFASSLSLGAQGGAPREAPLAQPPPRISPTQAAAPPAAAPAGLDWLAEPAGGRA